MYHHFILNVHFLSCITAMTVCKYEKRRVPNVGLNIFSSGKVFIIINRGPLQLYGQFTTSLNIQFANN